MMSAGAMGGGTELVIVKGGDGFREGLRVRLGGPP
jgi:hypothetical protein